MFRFIKLLTLFLFFVISINNYAQYINANIAWTNFYGSGGEGHKVLTDKEGNIIVAGTSSYYRYTTVKYSPMGVEQWTQIYNGGNYDEILSCTLDDSGNVYVTGRSGSFMSTKIVTIKYSKEGVEKWVASFSGNTTGIAQGTSITLDSLGNIYVTGNIFNSNSGSDYALIKYNNNGAEQWHSIYNGTGNGFDISEFVKIDRDLNVYVTGSCTGSNNYSDIVTIKYDENGNIRWTDLYDGDNHNLDYPSSLSITDNENIFVAGSSENSNSNSTFVVIRYDSSGSKKIVKKDNSGNAKLGSYVDRNGDLYVCESIIGEIISSKYDSNGNLIWDNNYKTTISPYLAKMIVDNSGNTYLTGMTNTNNDSLFILKINENGKQDWIQTFKNNNSVETRFGDIVCDELGNIYETGYTLFNGNKSIMTLKYVQTFSIASPVILSIKDVKNDQGLRVNIQWSSSILEEKYPNYELTDYQVWRFDNGKWKSIDTVAAQKIPTYNLNVPTLKDSTVKGTFWSTYFVTANTSNKNEFYCSYKDSGYSIDNIPPTAPKKITFNNIDGIVKLTWLPSKDSDLVNYEIYRSQIKRFAPSNDNIISEVTDTTFYDDPDTTAILQDTSIFYYVVASVDDAFNRSYSNEIKVTFIKHSNDSSHTKYLPLAIGNKWIFRTIEKDSSGIIYLDDTSNCFIQKYSIINDKRYYLLSGGPLILNGLFRTDSLKLYKYDSNNVENLIYNFSDENADTNKLADGTKIFLLNHYIDTLFNKATDVKNLCFESKEKTEISFAGKLGPIMQIKAGSKVNSVSQSNLLSFTISDSNYNIFTGLNKNNYITINSYELKQNYPNPFNPTTTISYSLDRASLVILKVYDILGREVATLVNKEKMPGNYSVVFNAINLASGMYIYRMQAGNFIATKKLILLK
ncbi:MAG: SBBP repeat-containing protein [Ignavibacteriaceae bacterium]